MLPHRRLAGPATLSTVMFSMIVVLPASVQDEQVHFDPVRDLPGYEAVRASPGKDAYPLEAFDALLGDEMDVVLLAATKKRWADERGAVDKMLAELAADPRDESHYGSTERNGLCSGSPDSTDSTNSPASHTCPARTHRLRRAELRRRVFAVDVLTGPTAAVRAS